MYGRNPHDGGWEPICSAKQISVCAREKQTLYEPQLTCIALRKPRSNPLRMLDELLCAVHDAGFL